MSLALATDRELILLAIDAERERQNELWGDQSAHTDDRWLTILTEEIGEAAEEILNGDLVDLSIELTQAAAVIVQWLEKIMSRAKLSEHQTS